MERESIPLMHIRHEFKEDHLDRSNGKLIRTDCFFAAEQQDLPIYTNGVEFAERRAPTWYHDSCNRYFLVTFLTEGSIRYWAGGEQFTLHANQILLIPQGMDYRFETLRNPHYRKNTLFLLGVNLAEILETFQLNQPMILPAEDSDFLVERFHQLREIVQSRETRLLPRNMGITMELLGRLSERGPSSVHLPLALRIAKSRLSGGFANAVSIAALAQELRMPLRTFNRMFRDHLGISPREFRKQCRMETAKGYLNHTAESIKEIAERLGYGNAFHFSGEFRRTFGISPQIFRVQERKKKISG